MIFILPWNWLVINKIQGHKSNTTNSCLYSGSRPTIVVKPSKKFTVGFHLLINGRRAQTLVSFGFIMPSSFGFEVSCSLDCDIFLKLSRRMAISFPSKEFKTILKY